MELGLCAFGDVTPGAGPGPRIRELIEEIELADNVGLDFFGLGEHHRPDYAVSAPPVVLAAARTKRIRLSSAVTVLSSDDPVRVFQQFATLDLITSGRAEIMAGRGSFIESYPLFGFNLADYDTLFSEKLDLLLKIRAGERVTWHGTMRPALDNAAVYPRPLQALLPVWIAVGGTPASVARAGTLNLPLMVAIIGGEPERFKPLFELHREAARRAKHDAAKLPSAFTLHGFIAASRREAMDILFEPYAAVMTRIGRERGWPPMTRAQFDAACGPDGHLAVGSPDEVAAKIIRLQKLFGNTRFCLQMGVGPVPHGAHLRAIELFGTEVAPRVRAGLKLAA